MPMMTSPTTSPARRARRPIGLVFLGEERGDDVGGADSPTSARPPTTTGHRYGRLVKDDHAVAYHSSHRMSTSTPLANSTITERQNLAASNASNYYASMGFGSSNEAAIACHNRAHSSGHGGEGTSDGGQHCAFDGPERSGRVPSSGSGWAGATSVRSNASVGTSNSCPRSPMGNGGVPFVFGASRSVSKGRRNTPAFLADIDSSTNCSINKGRFSVGSNLEDEDEDDDEGDADISPTPTTSHGLSPPTRPITGGSDARPAAHSGGLPPRPMAVIDKVKAVIMQAEDDEFD